MVVAVYRKILDHSASVPGIRPIYPRCIMIGEIYMDSS